MNNGRTERGAIGVAAIVAIGLVAALVVGGISFYGYVNALRTESVQRENALNAQYLSNQNYLSAYISGFYEQLGVANLKSDKLDQILSDSVKGRYESSGGFAPNGAFFSAIVEAYPQLGQLDIFDRIVDYVAAKREGYRAIQDKLLDMLRAYDTWRQDGIVQSWIVSSILGIPSQRLEARVGTQVWRGAEARDKMFQIVLASQAKQAYETGTMEPLTVPQAQPKPAEASPKPQQAPAPAAKPKAKKR